MKKLLIIFLFVCTICFIACDNEHITPIETPMELSNYNELYKDVNQLNDLGFYYSDYVKKSVVYRASFYSAFPEVPSNNNPGEGKVYHFYSSNYEYYPFYEFLEHYDELFSFGLANYMVKEDLVNCVGVKVKTLENDYLYDFVLLVDEDKNLYLIEQSIKSDFEYNIMLIHEVELLERIREVQFGSSIINNDYPKIAINEFKELIGQFNNDFDFSKLEDKLAYKITFFNDNYHYWYRLCDNYILSIYTDNIYDNVVFEMIYYEDGIATYVSKNIEKFERYIFDESVSKYFGKYLGVSDDSLTIGIGVNGLYMSFNIITKSGYNRKESGYFYLEDNYLVLDKSTKYMESKLYFEVIEDEEVIKLKYINSLSSDPYRPNPNDDSCVVPNNYIFEMKK